MNAYFLWYDENITILTVIKVCEGKKAGVKSAGAYYMTRAWLFSLNKILNKSYEDPPHVNMVEG